jgi:hypothetical protein
LGIILLKAEEPFLTTLTMSHSRKSLVELVETSFHQREIVGFDKFWFRQALVSTSSGFDKLNQRLHINVTLSKYSF